MNNVDSWFSRLLFLLVIALSAGILGLVLIAPWLESSSRIIVLFATDATVRQTSLACAIGMLVTACVFFRARQNRQPVRKSTPPGAIGA